MIAALALATAQAVTPAAYPADAVVAAFAQACRETADFPKAHAALTAAGWEPYTPAADSQLGKLLAKGRAAIAADPTLVTTDGGSWRRTVADQALSLTLTSVTTGDWTVNGCRLYDFDDARTLPVAALTALIGRAPNEDVTDPRLHKATWNPGFAAGMMATELYNVPAGSPVTAILGGHGIVLVAQTMNRKN